MENYKEYHGYYVYPNGDIVNQKTCKKVSTTIRRGYKSASIYYADDLHTIYVKDIVAKLFLDSYEDGLVVYCKDGNPENCSVYNLCQRKSKTKATPIQVIYPDGSIDVYQSQSVASEITGVKQGIISKLVKTGRKDKEGRLWLKVMT